MQRQTVTIIAFASNLLSRAYTTAYSNLQIEGITVEKWDDLVEKIKSFQSKIPYLKTIGWDIALTENGPVVVEINNWWDTTGQIFIGKGWRDAVLDCYNAWKDYYIQ